MKRELLTILLIMATAVCISAGALPSKAISLITGKEIQVSDIVPTIRDVDTTSINTTVSYHIENVILEPDSIFEGSYKCIISDFANSEIEGAPAFPIRTDYIELPFGCNTATLTITKASFMDIPCEMSPAYPFYIGNKIPAFTKDLITPITHCDFSSQSDLVTLKEIDNHLGHPYANIIINPCQYNSISKIIRIYTDFEYRIDYGSIDQEIVTRRNAAKEKQHSIYQAAMTKAKFGITVPDSLVIKFPELVDTDAPYHPALEDDYFDMYHNYLIITSDKYLEIANEFAAFKRKFGFITHVSSRSTWTPTQIQDTINSYYRNVAQGQQYLDALYALIIGGHADVPAMEINATILNSDTMQKQENAYVTDYYYSCLNGSKSRGLNLGRIPVNTIEEAKSAINKIKDYVMNPTGESNFFNTAVHIAQYDGVKTEYHPHVYGSEICRENTLRLRPDVNVKRLYCAYSYSNPEYYGYHDSQDYTLPMELQRPNYSWDTDKYDIATELDKGCFYVLYRGHGERTGYDFPSLTSDDIKNGIFKNGNKLPVFMNFTCLTGSFIEPGCMAESLLINPDGGGIGVFAATESTNCLANNALSKAMLYYWLKYSKNESKIYSETYKTNGWSSELGVMLEAAFFMNPELTPESALFHQTAYHIFGDPSMLVWTEQPREYTENEVWCQPHYDQFSGEIKYAEVLINLPDEGCYIAIEDKETHETFLGYGPIATFPKFDPKKYSMMIYGVNRIPLEINIPTTSSPVVTLGTEADLAFSPNPAKTTCLVGYHIQLNNQMYGPIGILSINNALTGKTMDEILVKGHIGRIELDVSKYPNGIYAVTLGTVPASGSSMSKILGRGKLIVQH